MPRLTLLFVHVPKTGGTSLTRAMETWFGDKLYRDHDGPANPASPMNLDPDGFLERHHNSPYAFLEHKEAVTGHIWIRKYDPVAADIRATILRHPIERALSHYFFWTSPSLKYRHPVRTYMLNKKVSFPEFARMPTTRWFYSRYIFRDTDMAMFDFIGDYDALRSDWSGVTRRLGLEAPALRCNETRSYSPDYSAHSAEILSDPVTMRALRDLLSDDISFYERWTGRG